MNVIQVPRRFVRSDWGGTETVILETSKRLLAKGHKTEILCPMALAKEKSEEMDGVLVERTGYFYPYIGLNEDKRRRLDQKGGNLFSFELWKRLNKYPKLDLIHLHTSKRLGGICRHVALRRGIPYIVSLHGGLIDVPAEEAATWTEPTKGCPEWGKILGYWVGSRRVFDDAAAILCVGAKEQEETQKRYPDKKVLFLPNGVDPDRFADGNGRQFRQKYGFAADDFIVLTVGRIDPQKNQSFAVDVYTELLKEQPNARLVLIGHVTNDTYFEKLKQKVSENGLSDKITVIPGLPSGGNELLDAFHGADVFFLPSVHEPFGIVILEAWAAGLPVVASRVGGIPSFTEHETDVLLFTSGNRAEAVQSLSTLAENRELRRSLAERGNAKAAGEYSWDKITDRLISIYEEAIHANPLRK